MNLTDRVRGVLAPRSQTGEPPADRLALSGPLPAPADAEPLESVLGGAWRSAGRGRVFVVQRKVDRSALYGSVRVDDCASGLERACERASLFTRTAVRPPLVFFDLETTGLSGGAGTYAFLVGLGWFSDDGYFVTRQYFLAEHSGEGPMLELVRQDLEGAGLLVSFNGKSFDAPVLESRCAFHRLGWIDTGRPHFDVLHPARRFWSGDEAEGGCSLVALERRLLGAGRTNDVPGFEIPARYFQFMRSGDAGPLAAVFEHNRLDLLTLAALTSRLLLIVEGGPAAAADAREALGLGHLYASAGLHAPAIEAFRRGVALKSASRRRDDGLTVMLLRSLALAARRTRAHDEAAVCWQQLMDLPACPSHIAREAAEALAIHHEHRRRDFMTARSFALRSLKREARPAWNDAVRHRLARLEKKLAGSSERPLFPSSSSLPFFGSRMSERRTSS